MTERHPLKLVVAYDRNRNEYSLVAHNQTPEEAQAFLDRWSSHLREGHLFCVLDQVKRHAKEDVQICRACRETVVRSAHFEPQPKFVRRKQE